MKKIAIPITENNLIDDHFGHSKFYEIYTFTETNEIIDLQLIEAEKGCGCKSNIISILVEKGVTYMISGNIGSKALHKLKDAGINVIEGCSGNSSDAIIKFIENKITDGGSSCTKHKHSCSH